MTEAVIVSTAPHANRKGLSRRAEQHRRSDNGRACCAVFDLGDCGSLFRSVNDFEQASRAHAATNAHRDNAILRPAPPFVHYRAMATAPVPESQHAMKSLDHLDSPTDPRIKYRRELPRGG
jgi:hypothetical protein